MTLSIVILALVTLQRLGELWLSNRNTRRLLARGAHEVGAGPLSADRRASTRVARGACGGSRPGRPVDGFWLALFVLLELARIWVLAIARRRAGRRGSSSCPDAPLVRRGPYRFVNHPNYLVVVGEIAVLPLVFGLWQVALVFTLLNAAVLAVRIRAENRALGR